VDLLGLRECALQKYRVFVVDPFSFLSPECYNIFASLTQMPTSLSFVSASFDVSCQSFIVTVSTIGVGGGVTVSATTVSPDANVAFDAATVTVPLTLEVIQDETVTVPEAGEISLSGRSAKGFSASSAVMVIASALATSAATTTTTITVALDLQPAYVRNTLSSITPPLRLVSLLAAWLSLLSIGGIFLRAHMAAASTIMGAPTAATLVAQAQAKITAEDIRSTMSNKSSRLLTVSSSLPRASIAVSRRKVHAIPSTVSQAATTHVASTSDDSTQPFHSQRDIVSINLAAGLAATAR
jgi:hypothetical protein